MCPRYEKNAIKKRQNTTGHFIKKEIAFFFHSFPRVRCCAQIYPDSNHGLGGARGHLYLALEDFLADHLGPLPDWFSYECQYEGSCYREKDRSLADIYYEIS